VCAPTPLHRPHENARRRQARGSGGRRAGGGDASLLRGPQGGGGGLGLGVAAGGGLQDPAQERRHEGGDAAGGRRHCPRRKSRVSTLLDSDYFSLRPAALLSPYCRAPFGVFFSVGGFLFWVQAFEKHTMEKDIAEYIKKEFDKNHGPTWHCIVGRNFGNALVPLPGNTPVHGSRWGDDCADSGWSITCYAFGFIIAVPHGRQIEPAYQ
jgi:hypothetical protein